MVSSAAHAAQAQERAGKGHTNMFRGTYDPPKDPKYQMYYERLRKERLLERFSEALSSIRLPKPLVIKFAGCDGTSNAWYEPADGRLRSATSTWTTCGRVPAAPRYTVSPWN